MKSSSARSEESIEKREPTSMESLCAKQYKSNSSSYIWYPSVNNVKQIEYVRKLECQYEQVQAAFLNLTSQFARLQFRLRQLMQAQPMERAKLIADLERIAFEEVDSFSQCKPEELPRIEKDNEKMGDLKKNQTLMICRLRGLVANLEKQSDCLMTEYRSDPEFELEQQKKCSGGQEMVEEPAPTPSPEAQSKTSGTSVQSKPPSGKVSATSSKSK